MDSLSVSHRRCTLGHQPTGLLCPPQCPSVASVFCLMANLFPFEVASQSSPPCEFTYNSSVCSWLGDSLLFQWFLTLHLLRLGVNSPRYFCCCHCCSIWSLNSSFLTNAVPLFSRSPKGISMHSEFPTHPQCSNYSVSCHYHKQCFSNSLPCVELGPGLSQPSWPLLGWLSFPHLHPTLRTPPFWSLSP